MDFGDLLNDKAVKSKTKTETLSKWILENPNKLKGLIDFASTAKDPVKATCIEAMEFATRNNPATGTMDCLEFVSKALTEKAPRVKWESAKVIANIAHLYPDNLDKAIKNLLGNSEHEGTVVRWSAAVALRQIIKMKKPRNKGLIQSIKSIVKREEQNSIKKIYLDALKEVNG